MIEIKNIIYTNQNLNLFKRIFCFINYLLPLKFKIAKESFVALENDKNLGIITLEKDSKSHSRLKITKLILEDAYSYIANELINYTMTRYRAMGAHSFYAVVDEKQADLINIFKNEMNFRMCANEYLWKVNFNQVNPLLYLKPFKRNNLEQVCNFYNENINSFNRFLFSREKYQFSNSCQKYLFLNDDETKILGYFEVATKNNLDFYINFSIDFTHSVYLIDAIKFIYTKLKQKNKKFNLYVKVKDYFMNSKEIITILKENNFEFISKSQILAKDYLRLQKQDSLLHNVKIIFNDPTTA